ncbi:MAG: shikimate kinase [Acholeplasmataceae bacterium]|nr:shikimate kinase [Acholeplasmataceae bacterium]
MRIYLIGMPGSGKSTVGRLLAKALNYQYIDLDGVIEKDALMFIPSIFETLGEVKFRKLETEALKSIEDENIVVSCGGGIVTVKENKAFMTGLKIYLDTDIEVIRNRLSNDYERPLLKEKSLDQIFDERFLKYQDFADVIVSNNVDIEETVKVILNYLAKGIHL